MTTSSSSVDLSGIRARHHGANPDAVYYSLITPQETSDLFDHIDRLQAQVAELRQQYGLYVHGAETEARQLRADLEHTRQIVGAQAEVVTAVRHIEAGPHGSEAGGSPCRACWGTVVDALARLDAADVPVASGGEETK